MTIKANKKYVSTYCLLVGLDYINIANAVRKRFLCFKATDGGTTAELISKVLLDQLSMFCSQEKEMDRDRLIAQTFEEASVMGEAIGGVRGKVQDIHLKLHLVHCSRSRTLLLLDT